MANIKLTLSAEPFSGQIVSFPAPCDCASVTDGLIINGETYTICDAMGNKVTGTGGVWCSGAQVSVVLDCENKKAYLQNGKPTPDMIGAVKKSGDTMTGDLNILDTSKGSKGRLMHSNHTTALHSFNDADDATTRRQISLYDSGAKANIADALALIDVVGGKATVHNILHTGNTDSLLGGFGKVVAGSYVGTGAYGESNPNSVVCGFAPKLFMVGKETISLDSSGGTVWVRGTTQGFGHPSNGYTVSLTWEDDGLSWYNSDAMKQLNIAGETYFWVAIG